MPHSIVPKIKDNQKHGYRGRRLAVIMIALFALSLSSQSAFAYNYAGYRWGGSWPKPIVDYSGISVNAWRVRLQNTMNDWNATGAKFTFRNGSSINDVYAYSDPNSEVLAYVDPDRQHGWWGDVVRVRLYINVAQPFNPPYSYGYDFSTIIRHELGHWLVLNHTNPPSLMQESLNPWDIRYVASDDRNAIRTIYGVQ